MPTMKPLPFAAAVLVAAMLSGAAVAQTMPSTKGSPSSGVQPETGTPAGVPKPGQTRDGPLTSDKDYIGTGAVTPRDQRTGDAGNRVPGGIAKDSGVQGGTGTPVGVPRPGKSVE